MPSEKGAEWLVGPDFTSSHGGVQIFGNDDKQCPERFVIVDRWSSFTSSSSIPWGEVLGVLVVLGAS